MKTTVSLNKSLNNRIAGFAFPANNLLIETSDETSVGRRRRPSGLRAAAL
jgi:hypothetical protein